MKLKAMFPFGWKRFSGFFHRFWKLRKRIEHADDQANPISGEVVVSSPESEEGGSAGRIENLDENLQKRSKHLGEAIKQSPSETEPIANVIADIQAAGYDIFLAIEATIGFNQPAQKRRKPAKGAAT